jgi:hypothetical protein
MLADVAGTYESCKCQTPKGDAKIREQLMRWEGTLKGFSLLELKACKACKAERCFFDTPTLASEGDFGLRVVSGLCRPTIVEVDEA